IDRIVTARPWRPTHDRRHRCGDFTFNCLCRCRRTSFASDVAARSLSLTNIHWNQSLNIPALRRPRRNALLSTAKSDSDSALFSNCRRRSTLAVHINNVASFALVRRTHHSLRLKTSAHRWTNDCCRGLCTFYFATRRRQLLDYILSAGGCSRARNGHDGCAAHDYGNEFSFTKS